MATPAHASALETPPEEPRAHARHRPRTRAYYRRRALARVALYAPMLAYAIAQAGAALARLS